MSDAELAVLLPVNDHRHFQPIEVVLLDDRVTTDVRETELLPHPDFLGKAIIAKDIPSETRPTAHAIDVTSRVSKSVGTSGERRSAPQLGGIIVRQHVEDVCLHPSIH